MPKVELTAHGKGVGATGEGEAFTQMVRVEIASVAAPAQPVVRVGAGDDVTVTVVVERREQAAVGSILERLLQDVDISSTVIDEDSSELRPTSEDLPDASDGDAEQGSDRGSRG